MSAESKTAPGGYVDKDRHDVEQFAVEDGRSVKEVVAAIEARGLDAVYKDFDTALAVDS
jgi:2-iminoacetate synthase